MEQSNSPHSALDDALTRSLDRSTATKLASITDLAALLDHPSARARLEQMLDDFVIPVQADAAEALVKYGGRSGLHAVLAVLGRREDDPDADYIAYALRDLAAAEEISMVEIASADDLSPMATAGLKALGELT